MITTKLIHEKDINDVYLMLVDLYDHLNKNGFVLKLNEEKIVKAIIETAVDSKFLKIVLAYVDGQLAGFINFGLAKFNTKFVRSNEKFLGNIIELYVKDEFRSHNVGSCLLKEAEKFFKEQKASVIQVNTMFSNTKAIDFYKKNGFTEDYTAFIKILE